MSTPNSFLTSDRRGRVCTLTLNRPEKKNALTPALVDTLNREIEGLAQENDQTVLVIRGAGEEAFCSGYDIFSLPAGRPDADAAANLQAVERLFQSVIHYPMPVIAMINGAAFGAGCELALCCDMRIAAADARIGMPPARLGLVYPWTGLRRFVQTISLRATKEMLFIGRTYEGERLRELGLVDYLVPREELETQVYQLAEEMAANAPLALRGIKRILNLLLHHPALSPSGIEESKSLVDRALASEDLGEGQAAFLEKRRPQFKGK